MARTKQTARKLPDKRIDISRRNKGKQKQKDKKPIPQGRRTKPTVCANQNDKKVVPADSNTKVTRVRIPYDSNRELGGQLLYIWLGPQPIGPVAEPAPIHTTLLPAQTLAILEASSTQFYQHDPRRFYLFDANPEIFEIYRRYLYSETRALQSIHESDQDFADDGDAESHPDGEWTKLAHAYLLGKKLQDEEFCNVVVNGIVEKTAETDRSPTGLATDIYANTAPGDKLRSLIVDLHVWEGQGTWLTPPHNDASGPPAFLQDVNEGLAAAGSAIKDPNVVMPWEVDICKYHSHDATTKCDRPAQARKSYATLTTQESQSIAADWFIKRSSGENVLDEDGDTIMVASPPITPRRSPRTAAVAKVVKQVYKPTAPNRR